jgi:hypothetical protein
MLRYGICVDIEVCYMLRMEFVVTQKDVTCYVMGSVLNYTRVTCYGVEFVLT